MIVEVKYELVVHTNDPLPDLVLMHDNATLVSIAAALGDAPTDLGSQGEGAERIHLNGETGTLHVTLEPSAGFAGRLSPTLSPAESDVAYPPDTYSQASTLVAPPGAMIVTAFLPAPGDTPVTVDVLSVQTAQPVRCEYATNVSTPFAAASPSRIVLVVPSSCVQGLSGNLRICWAPDACGTAIFSAGEHDLGMLVTTAQSPPNPVGPASGGAPVSAPNAGDGASAGRPERTPVVLALALAVLACTALGSGFVLRRR